MKKTNFILVVVFLFVSAFAVSAQDKPKEYFAGTWELLIEGTPGGDGIMVVNLNRKDDGKLAGTIVDKSKGTESKITRIDEKAKNVTLYFTSASGYEVYVFMEKGGDNDVSGSVMDMFDFTGKRVEKKDDKKEK